MATIEKIGPSAWRISKQYKGVRYRKIVNRKPSKAEAERLIWIEIERAPEHGVQGTFETAALDYNDSKSNILSPSTIDSYGSMLRNIPATFKVKSLSFVTQQDIQNVLNEYAASHSPKSVRNLSGYISAVMKSVIPDYSFTGTLPQRNPPDFYVPEDEDVRRILEASARTRYEVVLWLAVYGLRRSEAVGLDFDLEGHRIDADDNPCIDGENCLLRVNKSLVLGSDNQYHIKAPKTNDSIRTVRVSRYVMDLIMSQGYVYNGNPHSINEHLHRVQKRLDIPQFSLHMLRHYFASTSREVMPDEYVEKMGGWKKGSQIMRKVYSYTKKQQEAEAQGAYTDLISTRLS